MDDGSVMTSMMFLPMLMPHRVVLMVLITTSRMGRRGGGEGDGGITRGRHGRCMKMMVVIFSLSGEPSGGVSGELRWRKLWVTIRLSRRVVCVLLLELVVMRLSRWR